MSDYDIDQKNNSKSYHENDIEIPTQISTKTEKNIYLALVVQILATAAFASMNVFCKFAYRTTSQLTGFDYLFIRSPIMITLAYMQARYNNVEVFKIKEGFRMKLYAFGLSGTLGVPCFYVGIKYIPASIAALIHNTLNIET